MSLPIEFLEKYLSLSRRDDFISELSKINLSKLNIKEHQDLSTLINEFVESFDGSDVLEIKNIDNFIKNILSVIGKNVDKLQKNVSTYPNWRGSNLLRDQLLLWEYLSNNYFDLFGLYSKYLVEPESEEALMEQIPTEPEMDLDLGEGLTEEDISNIESELDGDVI